MSLFNEDGTPKDPNGAPNGNNAPAPSAIDQLLAGIKNERGEQKYSNVEAALSALQHSQEFIATLKREKEEVAAKLKAQEELEKLLAPRSQPAPVAEPQVVTKGVSEEDIVGILERREAALKARSNIGTVKEVLAEQFGAESGKELATRIAAVGVSKETADKIAAENPDAFLKLIGVERKKVPTTPVKSSINTGVPVKEEKTKKQFDPFSPAANSDVQRMREIAERVKAKYGAN